MNKPLSERRKQDREELARIVTHIATQAGATVEPEEGSPREIRLKIQAVGGLGLTLDFDGDSLQPDVYVLSWHMHWAMDSPLFLNPAFWPSLNTVHYHKATSVARGADELAVVLERCLQACKSGLAYCTEKPKPAFRP